MGGGAIHNCEYISKAFDTVPHSALKPCLARTGVPTPIVEFIENWLYDGHKTSFKTKEDIGVEITIRRGVKQSDPLSPVLSNLCLEQQPERNEEQTSVINVNESWKIPVLPFVDDVVLLGADEREAQRQVDVFLEYLNGLGMTISRDKSQTYWYWHGSTRM